VLGAAILIAALALVVEFALSLVQRILTPRGLRLAGVTDPAITLAPIVTES
jgi:ABC-type proline/glycine betaine transport system permease subunit